MPTATLTFNLPEDNSDFNNARRGGEYYSALWDIHNQLRSNYKYDQSDKETLKNIKQIIVDLYLEE